MYLIISFFLSLVTADNTDMELVDPQQAPQAVPAAAGDTLLDRLNRGEGQAPFGIPAEVKTDIQDAEKFLLTCPGEYSKKEYIMINKCDSSNGTAKFKSYLYSTSKKMIIKEFESLTGAGGGQNCDMSCDGGSKKTPPGFLFISNQGDANGKSHWASDNSGNKRYFMHDMGGSYCSNSNKRAIRYHSNKGMSGTEANGKKSEGCTVCSPEIFKEFGPKGSSGIPIPGNTIAYNVPTKGSKLGALKACSAPSK